MDPYGMEGDEYDYDFDLNNSLEESYGDYAPVYRAKESSQKRIIGGNIEHAPRASTSSFSNGNLKYSELSSSGEFSSLFAPLIAPDDESFKFSSTKKSTKSHSRKKDKSKHSRGSKRSKHRSKHSSSKRHESSSRHRSRKRSHERLSPALSDREESEEEEDEDESLEQRPSPGELPKGTIQEAYGNVMSLDQLLDDDEAVEDSFDDGGVPDESVDLGRHLTPEPSRLEPPGPREGREEEEEESYSLNDNSFVDESMASLHSEDGWEGEPLFEVGAIIEARYAGGDRYYRGTISSINGQGRSYSVMYDDGISESAVLPEAIRVARPMTAQVGPSRNVTNLPDRPTTAIPITSESVESVSEVYEEEETYGDEEFDQDPVHAVRAMPCPSSNRALQSEGHAPAESAEGDLSYSQDEFESMVVDSAVPTPPTPPTKPPTVPKPAEKKLEPLVSQYSSSSRRFYSTASPFASKTPSPPPPKQSPTVVEDPAPQSHQIVSASSVSTLPPSPQFPKQLADTVRFVEKKTPLFEQAVEMRREEKKPSAPPHSPVMASAPVSVESVPPPEVPPSVIKAKTASPRKGAPRQAPPSAPPAQSMPCQQHRCEQCQRSVCPCCGRSTQQNTSDGPPFSQQVPPAWRQNPPPQWQAYAPQMPPPPPQYGWYGYGMPYGMPSPYMYPQPQSWGMGMGPYGMPPPQFSPIHRPEEATEPPKPTPEPSPPSLYMPSAPLDMYRAPTQIPMPTSNADGMAMLHSTIASARKLYRQHLHFLKAHVQRSTSAVEHMLGASGVRGISRPVDHVSEVQRVCDRKHRE